jgi:hypothetical protein
MSHIDAALLEIHFLVFWNWLRCRDSGWISTSGGRVIIIRVQRGRGHRGIIVHGGKGPVLYEGGV